MPIIVVPPDVKGAPEMGTILKFTVRGEPQGKGRPRVVRNGLVTRTYTPEKTAVYENLIRLEYQQKYGDVCIVDKCLQVSITAYFAVPKSAGKRKRVQMLSGTLLPGKKPDCDNIAKCVCDALNGIAYRDDSQIVDLRVIKRYAVMPQIDIEITEGIEP